MCSTQSVALPEFQVPGGTGTVPSSSVVVLRIVDTDPDSAGILRGVPDDTRTASAATAFKRRHPWETRVPPPYWTGASLLAQAVLGRRDPVRLPRAVQPIGGLLAAASVAGFVTSAGELRRVDTTIRPEDPGTTTALTTQGLFGVSRNPIYVAMAGLLTGHALLRRSPLALLLVPGFVAVMNRVQIEPEERTLRTVFGAEYADYVEQVPRWLW